MNLCNPQMPCAEAAVSDIGEHVYFLRVGDLVKIGWSSDVFARLRHMKTAMPDEGKLVGIMVGSRKTEQLLHRQFAKCRERREWFRYEGELQEFIERQTVHKLWSMTLEAEDLVARMLGQS